MAGKVGAPATNVRGRRKLRMLVKKKTGENGDKFG
jgi:hypothetical protein